MSGQGIDPSMVYPQSGGALSFGHPPASTAGGFAGYGLDPQTIAMLYGSPSPQSPYAKRLDEASSQVLGDPSQLGGALSASQGKYDAAVNDKLAAIKRAAALISGSRGSSNTPLMAFGAGLLQNAPTFGSALGNAFTASLPEIEKQREQERFIAQNIGNLGIEEGNTGIASALEGQGALDKRLTMAGQLENEAGNIQSRSDLAGARDRASLMGYAGRITTAQVNADKGRYKYLGNTPDGQAGVYLDQRTSQQLLGDPVAPKVSGSGANRTQWMHDAWIRVHPGDEAGALDFVAGHRKLTDQEIRRSAYQAAEKELGAGADSADIDARAKDIAGVISGPEPVTSTPAAGSAPPAGNKPGDATIPGKTAANPVKPKSHDDFNKLPSGTFFVNPADGKVMQKK